MNKKWLLLLFMGIAVRGFSLPTPDFLQHSMIRYTNNPVINEILSDFSTDQVEVSTLTAPLDEINNMLRREALTLNRAVINKVLTILQCIDQYNPEQNKILTVIDYSLPSNEKRLWIFDLKQKKLLFHTYVSHGLKSGALLSRYFSNKNNSKASSIGVYKTEKAYYGREGRTLRLDGLDKGFNDHAMSRYIVMHGGWYVDEDFIKKYGRPGRSWGCPTLPLGLIKPIIDTIKNNSLLVIYYPSDRWFLKSTFLNCHDTSLAAQYAVEQQVKTNTLQQQAERESILFMDLNGNHRREENEPILVVTADEYEKLFHIKPPLARMLRRQMNAMEYIALSDVEFNQLFAVNNQILNYGNKDNVEPIYFVIPEVKMERGYYITQMKMTNPGKIKEVKLNPNDYSVYFDTKPAVHLRSTNHFIRWLGL